MSLEIFLIMNPVTMVALGVKEQMIGRKHSEKN
jgi:hypothetical protein